jgi:hypothetical protein
MEYKLHKFCELHFTALTYWDLSNSYEGLPLGISSVTKLTPEYRVLLEKVVVAQLAKTFPTLWNRRFITVYTRARHRYLSWARVVHTLPPLFL